MRDVSSSSVRTHGERARAFRRSDRRPSAAIQPKPRGKAKGGGFTRVCTQNFVYKKSPARKILAGDGGERLPHAKQGGMKHKIP